MGAELACAGFGNASAALCPPGEMAVEVILATGKTDVFALGALLGNVRSAT
jgi:hypothetical protein